MNDVQQNDSKTDPDANRVGEAARSGLEDLTRALDASPPARLRLRRVGRVSSIGHGVATLHGLPHVRSEEVLQIGSGGQALAWNLDRGEIGAVLLRQPESIGAGSEVQRSARLLEVPVGEELLGRVVDPLGRPLDGGHPLEVVERRPAEREAPAILARAPVSEPLQTGIKVVDALLPIGRGQRELILGDRQTGKTTIALDAIRNQRDHGVVCVYCAIGQRTSSVARVIAELERAGTLSQTIVVVSESEDLPGLQFIAPYAATSMAEWFMERGRDVLIVYDDLTRHAWAYRQLSLLLRRPPGREAYPGEIFYVHARLLERATHLAPEHGGGSLTALPIIETEAQNLAAYLPTNLISITDGQIALSPRLFRKGILPAVDVGRSVSRVGGRAQRPAFRQLAGPLRLAYAQFEELEAFARFGSQMEPDTRARLERGRRVREVLKQPAGRPLPVALQIAILTAVTHGVLDELDLSLVGPLQDRLERFGREAGAALWRRLQEGQVEDADHEELVREARRIAHELRADAERD